MRLNVRLPEGWADHSHENPDGPPTYLRDLSDEPGPLQISLTLYEGGEIPNPSEQTLVEMCRELGEQHALGRPTQENSGECAFGKFGTVIFRTSESPRIQFWRLSNGKDFVLATHVCSVEPEPVEVQEAEQIVKALTLEAVPKPKWKFW